MVNRNSLNYISYLSALLFLCISSLSWPAALQGLFWVKKVLIHRLEIINFAEKHLNHIGNYAEIGQSIMHNFDRIQAKGFWFELEAAASITKKYLEQISDEQVIAFHYWLTLPKLKIRREIDIVTNKRCIECKNINWLSLSTEQEEALLNKLKQQRSLVSWYNARKEPIAGYTHLKYVIWSQKPIPAHIKKQLNKHHICYQEGLDYISFATHIQARA